MLRANNVELGNVSPHWQYFWLEETTAAARTQVRKRRSEQEDGTSTAASAQGTRDSACAEN